MQQNNPLTTKYVFPNNISLNKNYGFAKHDKYYIV